MKAGALLLPILVAAALMAGCGDDDEDATVTETVSSTAETDTTGNTGVATEETGEEVRVGLPVVDEGPKSFTSPSGNIGCYLDSESVRCDIRKRDWEPPAGDPAEKNCELDYGQGISLDKTHAGFVCAGDTALGGPNTLGYGEAAQRGVFRCESSEKEMVCFNVESGAGFSLAREAYRIF